MVLALAQTWRRWTARVSGRATLCVPGETVRPTFLVRGKLETRKICVLDFENRSLARFLRELRPGDVVYDIGANLGLYAVPAAMKLAALGPGPGGRTGHVIAFEPVPQWADRLRANTRVNRLTNLDVFEVALSNFDGRADFVMKTQPGSGMGSLIGSYAETYLSGEPSDRIGVEVNRGDGFATRERLRKPTILKVDVEGAEHAVLDGLGPLLADPGCRFALIEVHHRLAKSDHSVETLLRQLGFVIERGPERRSEQHLFAIRSSGDGHRV